MRLLLREYVALLRESGELDALLPDLFLAMGLEPLSKAQVGVRQHGVDASAVGPDPQTGERTLFLATIKPGDVSRATWDDSATSVRASLNEILDVYHQRRLPAAHQDLPVRVLLVCGGDLKQDAEDNWNGYVSRATEPGVAFDFWGGDRLALLIEEHMLDEHLFPPEAQGLMRKALALLDQNEEAPVFFYDLVEHVLSDDELEGEGTGPRRRRVKALRLLTLCLGVVVRWAVSVENTRPAVLAAERAVLRAWELLRAHDDFGHRPSMEAVTRVYTVYLATAQAYAARVQPLCFTRDGLAGYAGHAEPVEGPLRAFEVAGILATLGANHAFLYLASERPEDGEVAQAAAEALAALVENTPAASTPLYDGHAVEVAIGALLLALTRRVDDATGWLVAIARRLGAAFQLERGFPVATDRYEDLLALERGDADVQALQEMSTLVPAIAELLAALGQDDRYAELSRVAREDLPGTTLQLWFPDDDSDALLYRQYAASESGSAFSPMSLPETAAEARERMGRLLDHQDAFDRFSCVVHEFPALGLIASRHYRTPVVPAYWQRVAPLYSPDGDAGAAPTP